MTLSLFDYRPPSASPKASEQSANLARVGGEIAPLVLRFLRGVGIGGEFCGAGLAKWVTEHRPEGLGANESPTRILRDLRAAGFVGYEVVNRARSLYRVSWVREQTP